MAKIFRPSALDDVRFKSTPIAPRLPQSSLSMTAIHRNNQSMQLIRISIDIAWEERRFQSLRTSSQVPWEWDIFYSQEPSLIVHRRDMQRPLPQAGSAKKICLWAFWIPKELWGVIFNKSHGTTGSNVLQFQYHANSMTTHRIPKVKCQKRHVAYLKIPISDKV